ncbi:hypothetical protein GCM10010530_00200 [Kribbella aluminosa]
MEYGDVVIDIVDHPEMGKSALDGIRPPVTVPGETTEQSQSSALYANFDRARSVFEGADEDLAEKAETWQAAVRVELGVPD